MHKYIINLAENKSKQRLLANVISIFVSTTTCPEEWNLKLILTVELGHLHLDKNSMRLVPFLLPERKSMHSS